MPTITSRIVGHRRGRSSRRTTRTAAAPVASAASSPSRTGRPTGRCAGPSARLGDVPQDVELVAGRRGEPGCQTRDPDRVEARPRAAARASARRRGRRRRPRRRERGGGAFVSVCRASRRRRLLVVAAAAGERSARRGERTANGALERTTALPGRVACDERDRRGGTARARARRELERQRAGRRPTRPFRQAVTGAGGQPQQPCPVDAVALASERDLTDGRRERRRPASARAGTCAIVPPRSRRASPARRRATTSASRRRRRGPTASRPSAVSSREWKSRRPTTFGWQNAIRSACA